MRTLVESNADVRAKAGKQRRIALHDAVINGRAGVTESILKRKVGINARASASRMPLSIAAQGNHLACVEDLLEKKAKVDAKTKENKRAALHGGAFKGILKSSSSFSSTKLASTHEM